MVETTISNAASFVGRYISFVGPRRENMDAIIVAYDPDTQEHTVECRNGKEMALVLAKVEFKWLVAKCEPAESRHALLAKAVRRDAVGRKLKVYNKARDKWYEGKIVGYDEETEKHKIQFEDVANPKELNLDKRKWRYTDLIGKRAPGSQSIASSKFAGVQRSTASSWIAYGGSSIGKSYIGTFPSEKDAALAHDVYARRACRSDINFHQEKITNREIEKRKLKHYINTFAPTTAGKSKYRGVHWQKNRKRWMARYTLAQTGQKNVNLGAFSEARHAALAFDAEARKRNRPRTHLNFPDEHPTAEQIESWKTNTSHYTMMGSRNKATSQYRGVSKARKSKEFHVQVNISRIVEAYGKKKGPLHFGLYADERQAALVYDRVCRSHGVPEKELNFPRDNPNQKQVRLFDDECYFCGKESPTDPVATNCNHVFCRHCIEEHLSSTNHCPSCHSSPLLVKDLKPVQLISWPKDDALTGKKRKRRGRKTSVSIKQDDPKEDTETGNEESGVDDEAATCIGSPVGKLEPGRVKNDPDDDCSLHDDDLAVLQPSKSEPHDDGGKAKKKRVKTEFEEQFESNDVNELAASRGLMEEEPCDSELSEDTCLTTSAKADKRRVKYDADGHAKSFGEDSVTSTKNQSSDEDNWIRGGEGRRRAKSEMSDDNRVGQHKGAKIPTGTQFKKHFTGHGTFVGQVMSFDGLHYKVYYEEDGDEEELSEDEFYSLEIL